MYHEFTMRDTVVIAIAQEDTDLRSHGRILTQFKPRAPFVVAADLRHETVKHYRRTASIFIDKQGIVRQIFPMLVHHRASWWPVLHEIDRIRASQ